MKHPTSRNLLAYFLASKHWQNYLQEKVLNTAYQSSHDPERYMTLLQKGNSNPKLGPVKMGVKVWDYVYDLYDCMIDTDLKKATKDRLSDEITDLLTYHEEMGTAEEIV